MKHKIEIEYEDLDEKDYRLLFKAEFDDSSAGVIRETLENYQTALLDARRDDNDESEVKE
jgi:hypothetical protein